MTSRDYARESYLKSSLVDLKAPIIPGESAGGIRLGQSIADLKHVIESFIPYFDTDLIQARGNFTIRYIHPDRSVYLQFDLLENKLFNIVCNKGYTGKLLDVIYVGMTYGELKEKGFTLIYDDTFEHYSIEGLNNITIEMNTKYIDSISQLPDNDLIIHIVTYTED